MRLKTGILAGTAVLFVTAITSISYGETQSELCKKMWGSFQGMRAMTGLMTADDSDFAKFSECAKVINTETETSIEKVSPDKNYKVLNEEVLYHAAEIEKAAAGKDLEEIQVQFRRLTIACRNCHKIYKSEMNLVP
jgi:cytochrome c556